MIPFEIPFLLLVGCAPPLWVEGYVVWAALRLKELDPVAWSRVAGELDPYHALMQLDPAIPLTLLFGTEVAEKVPGARALRLFAVVLAVFYWVGFFAAIPRFLAWFSLPGAAQ